MAVSRIVTDSVDAFRSDLKYNIFYCALVRTESSIMSALMKAAFFRSPASLVSMLKVNVEHKISYVTVSRNSSQQNIVKFLLFYFNS